MITEVSEWLRRGVAVNLEPGCGSQPVPRSGAGPRLSAVRPVRTTCSGPWSALAQGARIADRPAPREMLPGADGCHKLRPLERIGEAASRRKRALSWCERQV